VAALPSVVRDPLVAERLVHVRDARSGLTLALPAPPTGEPPRLSFPPRLGEHNETVYGALGYAPAQVADLRRRGVV
jgi:crotonobetainyl-CoA:carnitine CoA-transferase CaiB-like acyl-CoA transferase